MKHRKWVGGLLSAVILGFFSLTGCQDGNLFGRLHDRGDSGSISSLLSDAGNALRDKNYTEALALFERILEQEPNNAAALNGASIAAMAGAGLNIGQIITNLLSASSSSNGPHNLGGIIQGAREGFVTSQVASNSILYGLDLNAIDAVIDKAVCRQQKIVSGQANGIAANDIATLLNYGLVRLIRVVIRAVNSNYFDIASNNGTYEITPLVNFNTFCGDSSHQAIIEQIGKDVAGAYGALSRAVTLLNLSPTETMAEVRDDINNAAVTLLTLNGTNALPSACLTILSNVGITLSTFQNQTEAFNPPSSGC